jgi:hypothetical protein
MIWRSTTSRDVWMQPYESSTRRLSLNTQSLSGRSPTQNDVHTVQVTSTSSRFLAGLQALRHSLHLLLTWASAVWSTVAAKSIRTRYRTQPDKTW